MTMTHHAGDGPDIPEGFTAWEIESADGTLEFDGKLLGTVNNERRGRSRWAEIVLYKYLISDPADPRYGQQAYLLHTMGHSVVYHRHDSACGQGVPVPVEEFPLRAEFPDDLEPCTDTLVRGRVVASGCYPPDWTKAKAGTVFDLEVLRHLQYFCPTADDVLHQLRRPSRELCEACGGDGSIANGVRRVACSACHGKGSVPGEPALSAPGQRLIEIVRFRDPDIARAANRTVKL